MSYARFGWDNSDVYVIGTARDGKNTVQCCACHFTPSRDIPREEIDAMPDGIVKQMRAAFGFEYTGPFPEYDTKDGILAHLREHREKGDHVPEDVFTRIREDNWVE